MHITQLINNCKKPAVKILPPEVCTDYLLVIVLLLVHIWLRIDMHILWLFRLHHGKKVLWGNICIVYCISVKVGRRSKAVTVEARGIFVGAKVVRGPDWDWGDQDGRYYWQVSTLTTDGWDNVNFDILNILYFCAFESVLITASDLIHINIHMYMHIYTPCFIKSGPLCIFAITFSNVDRFECTLHHCIR